MAEYEDLDDATLQETLENATSYEERSKVRQILRQRKKQRGQEMGQKPRGNSVYNRFAGSTAPTKKHASFVPLQSASKQEKNIAPEKQVQPKKSTLTKHEPPVQNPTLPSPSPEIVEETEPTDAATDDKDLPSVCESEVTPADEDEVTAADEDEMTAADEDDIPISSEPSEDRQYSLPDEDASPSWEEEQETVTDKEVVAEEPDDDSPTVDTIAASSEHQNITDGNNDIDNEAGHSSPEKELHQYLVAYVNKELSLQPPLPTRGKALFDTCSNPSNLCKLINKSVSGTVDLRALSKIEGSAAKRREAHSDNMMLAVESGRALGCHIHDDVDVTIEKIIQKEPETITNFLVDLIRARVVNLPGMEDEPSSSFTNWTYLFSKLDISMDSDKAAGQKEGNTKDTRESARSDMSYEERAALRKAEREKRLKEKTEDSASLTYEERALQRKAERERRRKEREALAK